MIVFLQRTCLWLTAVCLLAAPCALANDQLVSSTTPAPVKTGAEDGPGDELHIYLLIGQSNMAGRATVTKDIAGVIDRCYLLNDKDEWVPAKNPLNLYSTIRKGEGMQKLGPGYSFAQAMLEANPDIKIGLVVNARGGSKIEQWERKSKYYMQAGERTKAAMKHGTLKGVLWHQGESNSGNPDGYLDRLKSLIADLRKDMGVEHLPFVAGQVSNKPLLKINDIIAKLPESVSNTAVVSSEGLKTYDRWHFDTESQLELGRRYAKQMIALQEAAKEDVVAPKKAE